MKKMLFIVNPKAGRTTLKNCLIDVIDIFCKKDYEVRIYLTQGVGDAQSWGVRPMPAALTASI